MVAAMIQFTIEIQIANSALDVHLSDLKKHQEWQDYLATPKVRGKKSRKVVPPPRPHQLANIQPNQQVGLFLIVFALQIANDRQSIFFGNVQALAQIINFFTLITSNNTITEC